MRNPAMMIPYLGKKGMINWFPDKIYLKLTYYSRIKRSLNFNNPISFNAKLQWLKIYDRNSMYTKLCDKYEVREYIGRKLGEQYLIPLLGVYNNFSEINFEELPDRFVLKCTHDSGGVIICKDKSQFNIEDAKKKMNRWLKRNYYYSTREWPYKNIKPRIICEQYMVDESGTELKDYKLMCFNGKVKCSFVCLNRNSKKGLNVDFYDMDWKLMPFERHYHNSGRIIPKPKNFDKMIKIAEELSKDIPFVRVDLYEINGQVYFGELTLYPGSGFQEFTPESYDYLLGSWLELPNKVF